MTRRVPLALLTALAAGFLVLTALLPPAGAAAPGDALKLRVTALDAVLTSARSVLRVGLAVHIPDPADSAELRIRATLHQRAQSRSALEAAMRGARPGPVLHTLDEAEVPPSGGEAVLRADAATLGVDRPSAQGVYPLRIALERREHSPEASQATPDWSVLDVVTTSVVVAPARVAQPLRVALLVPLDHAPGLLADGSYEDRLPRAVAPGGTLDRISQELEDGANVPLTLAPSGYLLEQIEDLADGYRSGGVEIDATDPRARDAASVLARVRAVAGRPGVEQVASPYGPADLVALVRGGLASEARRAIVEGAGAIERATGQPVLGGVLVPGDGLDKATLAAVAAERVTAVVLDRTALSDERSTTTPGAVVELASGERVLTPDPQLMRALSGSGDPAVMAQRVLAETAAAYFERPFARAPRGLLVAPPARWRPQPGVLRAVLDRLGSAAWIKPVTLAQLPRPAADADGPTLVYPSAARERELSASYLASLADARAGLGALAAVLPAEDPTPGRFDRMLLAAAATWYRQGGRTQGRVRIAAVQSTIDQVNRAIRVVEEQPVTLTSVEDQQLPITLASTAPLPLRVRVRIEAAPVAFQGGNTRTVVLAPGVPTTLVFPVRVVNPGGTFAANVIVTDPDGARALASGSVHVRSTAYSIVALLLTTGAGLFLLLWWVRDVAQRRAARRPA